MALNMEEILRQIGWVNGNHLPVANVENRALQVEFEKLLLRKLKAKVTYEEATCKTDALKNHMKYLQQEFEQNQKLLSAYGQQIEGERCRYVKVKCEYERINQEMRLIDKHKNEILSRQEDKKKDLVKALEKIETSKMSTAWDSEALKAWEDSLNKRTDDADFLTELSKQDERKVNELRKRLQQLQTEVFEKKNTVKKMDAEIRNYEQMLDRSAKLLQQQDEERKSLVERWHDALKIVQQKHCNISKAHKNMIHLKESISKREEELKTEKDFLDNQQNINKSVKVEIGELEVLRLRTKKELDELIRHNEDTTHDLDILKHHMVVIAGKLEQERQIARRQETEEDMMHKKVVNLTKENKQLQKMLTETHSSSMTTSRKIKHLQKMIDEAQALSKCFAWDKNQMEALLYKSQFCMDEALKNKKSIETQISAAALAIKHLESQVRLRSHEVDKQKESVYNFSLIVNKLEQRISEVEGRKGTEKEITKISDLENTLAEHNDTKNFIQGQIMKLQHAMGRLNVVIFGDKNKLATLRAKLTDQLLMFDGGVKQAAASKLSSQQKQVEENLLRLRVSQLQDAISTEDDDIYDKKSFKIRMEMALKEREIEMQTKKEILQAKKRNLEEDRSRLKSDINQRKIHVDHLQKKYHLALMAMGSNADGQPLTIVDHRIKSEQRKQTLQNEHDELNSKIQKAEKEIVAMENTLKVVVMTNDAFQRSMMPADDKSYEELELERVEQEILKTNKVLKEQKKVLSEKRKELRQLQENLHLVQKRWDEERKNLEDVENNYLNLKQEDVIRQEKVVKSFHEIKTYKNRVPSPKLEKPERNLQIRQLQDANKTALHQLASFVGDYEETTSVVLKSLEHYNLELPSRTSKVTTSSSSMVSLSTCKQSCSSQSCTALTNVVLTFDNNAKK